jgi:hypothetical protein
LDDLTGKEAWKGNVVCTACRFWLTGAREPLEKKDESTDWLEGRQRGWVERIEIVDDERYTKRLEKLAVAQLQGHSSVSADRVKHVKASARTHVKTPGSDSVSCQPLESSSPDILWLGQSKLESERGQVELAVDAASAGTNRVRVATWSARFQCRPGAPSCLGVS